MPSTGFCYYSLFTNNYLSVLRLSHSIYIVVSYHFSFFLPFLSISRRFVHQLLTHLAFGISLYFRFVLIMFFACWITIWKNYEIGSKTSPQKRRTASNQNNKKIILSYNCRSVIVICTIKQSAISQPYFFLLLFFLLYFISDKCNVYWFGRASLKCNAIFTKRMISIAYSGKMVQRSIWG